LRAVALLTESNSTLSAKAIELGLLAQNVLGEVTNCNPSKFPLLVIGGSNSAWGEATAQLSALSSYVNAGGKLLLHRPSASFIAAAQTALFPNLDGVDAQVGSLLHGSTTNTPVRLTSHDVHWVSQAGTYNVNEVISTNIAQRYYRKHFNLASYSTIQVENMYHSAGSTNPGGWNLNVNGYVSQNITNAQSGTYLFNILAKGTPVTNIWPHMALKIDGRTVDAVNVTTSNFAYYTLSSDLTNGIHSLAVYFDNDAYAVPEDRNLYLDEIRWGRDTDNSPTALLSRPGAVAMERRGLGLVLLDEICWDTETLNGTKAARFGSTLLTGLGGAFRQSPGLGIEAETMTNVNVTPGNFTISGGIVRLNSNGRMETSVRITASGSYAFEVIAGGTAVTNVLPQVAITVDGTSKTNWFLTSTNMTSYKFTLTLTAGTHTIGLAFLNDLNYGGQDRNAYFDRMVIIPLTAPLLAMTDINPVAHTTTLQWEATPGTTYEIRCATNLGTANWQVLTNVVSNGTVAGWQDSSEVSSNAPLTPAVPQRFYRVRQISP
ncbi:MAG: carbohydrate-binding domain-containing protein, partial [Verrucomicrobiota bacterium]